MFSHRNRTLHILAMALAAVVLALETPRAQARPFDLLTASIADIHAAVDAGKLTYEGLVGLYLKRIDAYDKKGPALRAVLTVNPRAIEIARELDAERKAKGRRSPLHGIPIAVKDNIDTADMATTGGNEVFAGNRPATDATVIQRLKQAGAIILIKTNMDELAQATQGLSTVGGQILNPYNLAKGPGGSSGGTGVSVASAFAAVGLGTETGVSVRSPAANNALVGIVPSRGLVSRAGVIPISFTQDRIGPLAKSVTDAATLLTYMRGFDADDLATAESLDHAMPVYTDFTGNNLRGKRVGVLRDMFKKGKDVEAGNATIDKQIDLLRTNGAIVVDGLSTGVDLIALMPSLRVNSYELKPAFDSYLRRRGPASPVKTFTELHASGKWLKGGVLEARFRETMATGDLHANVEYLSRLQNQRMVRKLLVDLMDRYGVEALVYPMKPLSAPVAGAADDGPRDNNLSATVGLPAIVVPAGWDAEGLPLSMEILGRPFSDASLIKLAYGYEQVSKHRASPKTTPALAGDMIPF
jgi:Asp-tRNA(Asn)/Glu-tRNA(Gln) amidotransferase A subunit family amidase